MLYKTLRIVATLALVALTSSTCDAATRTTAPPSNNSMSVGDGTNVNSSTSTTVFLGTEYNANRCVLQFASLDCLSSTKTNRCGELNGYPLECVDVGNLNGKEKRTCQCRSNETDWCQNSTAPTITGGYQFDSCSDSKPCADTYGHVPTKLELRVCAEKLHCVKEVNTTASQPAQICHTCRSCIAQNDAQGAQLTDKRRFDCTKICPKEVLDSIAKRNKNKVGIADEVSSESDSGSGEDSAAADKNSSAGSSGSKKATDKSMATTVPTVSAATVVVSIVVTALSVVLLQ